MSEAEDPPELTAAPADGFFGRLADNKVGLLILLFGVTGCLGLPLLVISRRFTPGQKWFWGILNTLYTLGLIAAVGALLWHVYAMVAAL